MKTKILLLLLIAAPAAGQSKLDTAWRIEQWTAYAPAMLDSLSTSAEIRRGYVESNAVINLMIPRGSPAPVARSAYMLAETAALHIVFNYAWKKCGTSKACKITCMIGRGVFPALSVKSTIHNMRLP